MNAQNFCLAEKYFKMKKSDCKEALEIYKRFLTRVTKIGEFVKLAEVRGDRRHSVTTKRRGEVWERRFQILLPSTDSRSREKRHSRHQLRKLRTGLFFFLLVGFAGENVTHMKTTHPTHTQKHPRLTLHKSPHPSVSTRG